MLLKVFLNLWHLLYCGGKSPLCGEERRRSPSVEKIKPLQMEKKSKYLWWILEMGEYGGSASAINASSPRPALKEKCLAVDRRVHSPRVVSARILSGMLMARRDRQHTRICTLSIHVKI